MLFALQLSHRLAAAATLLLVVVFTLAVMQKPADSAAWLTLGVADAAVILAAATLISSYRRARPVRQSLGLVFASLVIIHLTAGLMLTHFSTADRVRTYFNSPGKP